MGEPAQRYHHRSHSQQRLRAQPGAASAHDDALAIGDVHNVSASSIVLKTRPANNWQWSVSAVATIVGLTALWFVLLELTVPKPTLIPEWTPGALLAKADPQKPELFPR